jgi:hypothetical protein
VLMMTFGGRSYAWRINPAFHDCSVADWTTPSIGSSPSVHDITLQAQELGSTCPPTQPRRAGPKQAPSSTVEDLIVSVR